MTSISKLIFAYCNEVQTLSQVWQMTFSDRMPAEIESCDEYKAMRKGLVASLSAELKAALDKHQEQVFRSPISRELLLLCASASQMKLLRCTETGRSIPIIDEVDARIKRMGGGKMVLSAIPQEVQKLGVDLSRIASLALDYTTLDNQMRLIFSERFNGFRDLNSASDGNSGIPEYFLDQDPESFQYWLSFKSGSQGDGYTPPEHYFNIHPVVSELFRDPLLREIRLSASSLSHLKWLLTN